MKKTFAILFSLCALSLLNGCDDYLTFVVKPPEEIEVECTNEGETRYAHNPNGFCEKQVCQDSKWVRQEDSCGEVSCKKDSEGAYTCGDCLNNTPEYKFENDQCMKRTCEIGEWSAYKEDPGSVFCGNCKDGDTLYAHNPNGFCEKQVCQDNKWVSQESCGEVSCKTEKLNVDGLTVETLQCGECISGTTEYAVFEQCQKRTCTNGKWSAYSNEPDVSKCGTCNDGESKYQNELEDNKLICKKYDCIQGKYQADNSFKTICQNSCNNLSNGCGACINDYARARENENICITEICKNGAWKEEDNTCTASCTSISAESGEPQDNLSETCGECINNKLYYKNGEDNICQKYSCQSGKLTLEDFECEHSCDTNKANSPEGGCGVCKNGDIHFDNDEHGICKRNICKDGNWTVDNFYSCTKSCLNEDNSEDQSDQCGQCVNDSENFFNDQTSHCKKQKCEQGQFVEDNTFECSNSCNDKGCGSCINGDQRCQNGTDLETCVNGQFQHTLQCPTECKQEGNKAQCQAACDNEGEIKCSNVNNIGIKSECTEGKVYQTTCQGNVLCQSDTKCGECQYGETLCENSVEKKCVDGKWQEAPCSNGNSCNGNKCGECKDGSTTYNDLPTQQCQEYKCMNGTWKANSLCENNVSCTHQNNNTIICGSCTNYTFSTDDKKLQTCINGNKESNEECGKWLAWKNRFETIGVYIGCYDNDAILNPNDKINCYNKRENKGLVGYVRDNDTPCNENTPVSCHVIGVNQTACGECLELETRCDGQTPQTCINGKWTTDLPEWHTADRCANN